MVLKKIVIIFQLVLSFLLITFSVSFRYLIEDLGGQSLQIVGLFSNCHKNTNNDTETESESFIFDKTAEYIFSGNYNRNEAWKTMFNSGWADYNLNYTFEYKSFKICTENDLLKILMDIHLDQEYFVNNKTQNPPIFNEYNVTDWQQQTKVLFIVSYLPTSMTKILAEITLASPIPVVLLNETESQSIYRYDDHLRFKPDIFTYASKSYDLIVDVLQSQSVVILSFIEPTQTIDERISRFLAGGLEKNYFCSTYISIRSRSIDVYFKIVDYLRRDDQNRVIALFGDEYQQMLFLDVAMYSGLDHRTWVIHHVMNLELRYSRILPNTTIYSLWSLDIWLCSHVSIDSHVFKTPTNMTSIATYRNLEAICEYETVFDILIMALRHLNAKTGVANYNTFRKEFLRLFHPQQYLYKFLTINQTIVATPWLMRNVQKLWQNCAIFTCLPGWERHYGRLLKEHTVWFSSQGWTCKQCERNFSKSSLGDGPCTKCPDLQMSKNNETACYDPFVNRSITLERVSTKLMIALSVVVFIVDVFLLCLFFKYRHTPVVKTADIKFITVQILTSVLLTILLPMLTIDEPSYTKCLYKLIITSLLFTMSFSIFLVKSLTMVRAFSSDVVLTRKEIVYTSFVQWFIIGLLLLISQSITIITLMTNPVKVDQVNIFFLGSRLYC